MVVWLLALLLSLSAGQECRTRQSTGSLLTKHLSKIMSLRILSDPGADTRVPCVFPFKYKGKTYNK